MAYYYQYGIVVLVTILAVVSAGFNFGYNNSYSCHCENNTRCDTVTGNCSNGCLESWGGPICQQENIALHSDFVKQSSTLLNNVRVFGPMRAVDRYPYFSCSNNDFEGEFWWFIDLQQQYSLRYMTLSYGVGNISFSVHINDELCFQHSGISSLLAKFLVDCGKTLTGRYVNISSNRPDGSSLFGIRLCDVEIFVCARGTYGSDCNNFCHCSNLEECDVKTGKCPDGCQLGWYGDNCNIAKCDDGYYILGESCVRCTCGDNCNSDTGVCDGECHEHCIDQKCDDMKRCTEGCSVGYYGDYCDLPCHSNCNGNICDGNGNCINGCINGYHGRICDKKCAVNCTRCNILSGDCVECIKPWYGDACTHQCSHCVDGNCYVNGTCKEDVSISDASLELLTGKPNELLEGTLVEYACKFRLVSINGQSKPIVRWFLNEAVLRVTHRSRMKMRNLTDPIDRSRYTYILQFDSATPDDDGELKCMVQSSRNSAVNTLQTEIQIIPKPVLTIWPMSTLLKDRDSVTLNCSSSTPSSTPVIYSWFHAKNHSEIISAGNKSEYTVKMVDRDIQIYCKGKNLAGTSQSPIVKVYYAESSDEGIMCKKSSDSRNTTWSPTKAGTTSTNRCGDDYNGMSQRHCSEAGIWSQPDYSKCKLKKLVELKRTTEDVIEGKLVTTPDRTLQMLANLTTDGPQLSAGDVEVSVQILKDVVDITNDDSQVVIGKPELKNFAQSASNILDADGEEWITLAEQGKSGIAVMMDIVDSMAKLSSSRLENNQSITASTDKMIIEIGRSSLSDIEFPRPDSTDYPDWLTHSSNKVVLRKESLGEKNISYNAVYYNDISKIVEGRILTPGETIGSKSDKPVDINSKIVAVSIIPSPEKLDPPIELSFQHLSDNYSVSTCVFLDLKPPYDKRGRWSTEGCKTESTSNPNVTICKCDHLTNFAILMSPGRTSIKHREVLSIISAVGCVISICCLLLTVFVYGYFWRYVKSDKAIILMNLCVTLIIAYIIFLGGVTRTDSKALCQTVAVLLHFFFLAVFFLMLAEGVQVLISVVALAMKSRLKWILSASWAIPIILVIISMVATRLHGYGNDNYCWLSLESGLLWAFVGPALAVILINLIIVVKVLTVMFSTTTMVTKSMKEKGRTGLKALCVLLPIIGLTWVFGVFSVNGYTVVFQYLFAIFNSLQGLFIFIFHCALNRQVNEAVKIRRRRYRAKSIDTGTGTKSSSFPMQSNQTRSMTDSDKATNVLDDKKSPVEETECQVHPQP